MLSLGNRAGRCLAREEDLDKTAASVVNADRRKQAVVCLSEADNGKRAGDRAHMPFQGKPPGSGAGDISKRTEALRPTILLTPREAAEARRRRRSGDSPEDIASAMGKPLDEIEKVLVQMRMPRPETTRGTVNVTLAAHRLIMSERHGDEPLWTTMDRLLDELLRLRQAQEAVAQRAAVQAAAAQVSGAQAASVSAVSVNAGAGGPGQHRRPNRPRQDEASLPLLAGLE